MNLFLPVTLVLTTLLLCYAAYCYLVVDKRHEKQVLANPELFEQIDDKNYAFELPQEIDEYNELAETEPSDQRTLPLALLKRAMADIPLIEQLEKDHPRMARLFNRGLLPFGLWEQLLEAEALMDSEVHEVQAEAEKLKTGWGQGVFGQAYQMLRKEREEAEQRAAIRKIAGILTIDMQGAGGKGSVSLVAEGRNVAQQTQMVLRNDSAAEVLGHKSEARARIVLGYGDDERTYECDGEVALDLASEKQWKQLGQDPSGLRLQLKFVRKSAGTSAEGGATFVLADVRATVPPKE